MARYWRVSAMRTASNSLAVSYFALSSNGTDYPTAVLTAALSAGFRIQWDLLVDVNVTAVKITAITQPDFPIDVFLESSVDGLVWAANQLTSGKITYPGDAAQVVIGGSIPTVFLANFDVGLVDNSGFSKTVTPYGNSQISTTQKKFGASSAYFDGAGDYLSVTDAVFAFGAEFTLEAWFYPTDINTGGGVGSLAQYLDAAGMYGANIWFRPGGAIWARIGRSEASLYVDIVSTVNFVANAWVHVALTRAADGLCKLWVGGVFAGQVTSARVLTMTNLVVGRSTTSYDGDYFTGYIDDVRISCIAQYTAAFAPPTQAHTRYAFDPAVALMVNGNGVDSSTVFIDETGKVISPYGNVKISTAQSKFGGSSVYFDGVGDYLESPTSTDFDFGTGDLTIECFVKPDLASQVGVLVGRQEPGNGMAMQLLQHTATITWTTRSFGGGTVYSFGGGTLSTAEWQHVAVTRKEGVARLWLNGILVNTANDPTNLSCAGRPLSIGILDDTTLNAPYKGYIDCVRITKGFARYIENFTPSITPLTGFITPGVEIAQPTNNGLQSGVTNIADEFMPASGLSLVPSQVALLDVVDGGTHAVVGTVAEKALPTNTPLSRRVMLIDEQSHRVVRETWSDAAGNYAFNSVRAGTTYTVLAYDHTNSYRAVIADNLVPTQL